MKIEENRGLNDKKASKDQLVSFCQFNFGALSLTLGKLEHSWSTLALDQENQRKRKEGRRKQRSSMETKIEQS